jgi:hypothetical protein
MAEEHQRLLTLADFYECPAELCFAPPGFPGQQYELRITAGCLLQRLV